MADLLIKHGANVNKQNDLGKTPLHLAAEHGKTSVVNLLHNNGADINIRDKNGKTASESTQQQLNTYCILC